ncbi:MAG: hypothetical protein ABIG63_21640 [Chloroflexota bacterium]
MTEIRYGIPLTEVIDLPEPLASIVRLLQQTCWHDEAEMDEVTVSSTLDSIRWLLDNEQ